MVRRGAIRIVVHAPPPGEPADWRTQRRPLPDMSRRIWRREGGFRFSGPSSPPNPTLSGNARVRVSRKQRIH